MLDVRAGTNATGGSFDNSTKSYFGLRNAGGTHWRLNVMDKLGMEYCIGSSDPLDSFVLELYGDSEAYTFAEACRHFLQTYENRCQHGKIKPVIFHDLPIRGIDDPR